MKVTSFICSGIPCDYPKGGYIFNTLKDAIEDFKDYINDCDRIGNSWQNAYIEVTCDKWENSRIYEVTKRKAIKLIK